MAGFPSQTGKFLAAFAHDERGATAIEYGLIASGIFVAIVIAVHTMASSINVMYNMISDEVVESLS